MLSWDEIAISNLKFNIAEEYEIGPKQRRRANPKKADAMDEDTEHEKTVPGQDEIDHKSKVTVVAPSISQVSTLSSAESAWQPSICPLAKVKESDTITKADVIKNIQKRYKPRCGGGEYLEAVGNSLLRARSGIMTSLNAFDFSSNALSS
jgi:hypothetical protein